MTAGGRPWQLPAVLGSVPGPSLWRQWTPTSCARTVVTGGRSLSGARDHPPLPPLAPATLPAIRDSVYHMLWPETSPDSSLSVDTAIMYTLSDIWTDDFYKVGGMQVSVKCSISLLSIISSHKMWVIALMFICNSEKNQKMFFDRNHQKKQLL